MTVTEHIAESGERDWSVETDPEDMPVVNIIGLLETGKAYLLLAVVKDGDA